MTTRREIVRAGAGLAAIIAAGKAPAALVKSMLGMRGTMTSGKHLPYDAQVEYLESTVGQYIDTGVPANKTTYNKLRQRIIEQVTSTGGGEWRTTGVGTYGNCWFTGFNINDGRFYYGSGYGNTYTGISVTPTNSPLDKFEYDLDFPGNRYVVRNLTLNTTPVNLSSLTKRSPLASKSYTLALFRFNGDNGAHNARIFLAQYWMDGILIRDFTPVRFTNEYGQSEGAMFDRANPTVGMNRDGTPRDDGLYLNRGTGAFRFA